MSITKEQLESLYIDQGLTIRQCAEVLGLPTSGGISWRLRKFGIPARPQLQTDKFHGGGQPPEKHGSWKGGKQVVQCDACGNNLERFPSLIGENNFCNRACRADWLRQDLMGQSFGMLKVIREIGRDKHNHVLWECLCDCGETKNTNTSDLSNGKVKSCGCQSHPIGDANHKWKGGKSIEVKCANPLCHETKFIYPSHKKAYGHFFCSHKCAGEYRSAALKGKNSPKYKNRITVQCAYCGKALEITQYKTRLYKNCFCKGTDCQSKWRSENLKGEANANYHGGTPEMRIIRKRISAAMRKAIKQNKAGRHWETLVDYSMVDLINRLKSTVPQGYSWNQDFVNGNGALHIDHKRPMSSFDFNTVEDEEFKQCFALDNLQLLPAIENMKKNAKYDGQQIII